MFYVHVGKSPYALIYFQYLDLNIALMRNHIYIFLIRQGLLPKTIPIMVSIIIIIIIDIMARMGLCHPKYCEEQALYQTMEMADDSGEHS